MSIGASTKGVLLGIVSLSALDLLIASKNGPQAFGLIATAPGKALDNWFDPTKPLIKDLRTPASSGSSGGSKDTGGRCGKLFGFSKTLCEWQVSDTTPTALPNPSTPPTSSTVSALSA